MKKSTRNAAAYAVITAATAATVLGVQKARSQAFGRQQSAYTCEVKITEENGYRVIASNGIPDHATGQFPNVNNPNTISPQRYNFMVPLHPKKAITATYRPTYAGVFGIALNGVPFDPGTAETWNGDRTWTYEALSGFFAGRGGLGVDDSLAHVQPGGAYHYHGLPYAFLKKRGYTTHPTLVGYAADGYPMYADYGYADAAKPGSGIKKLKSSYRIKSGNRQGGPGGVYDGSFAQDYEFVKGLGDLDASNGRTGVTPEYPKGTYYYVLTDTFPFVPRLLAGDSDPSFSRRGPGGQGGPGGFGGPGQGGPGGFGGPGQGGPGGFGGPGQGGPGGFGGPGQGGPGGFGGPGQGGPGGFGGPGQQRFGPPMDFVPVDPLKAYLGLTKAQSEKLDLYKKVVERLRNSTFALPQFSKLKLTDLQIKKIAGGAEPRSVLTADQKSTWDANQRPGQGGSGGGPRR